MAENEYVIVNKADFEKIGNAVRTSNGTTDKYSISELADAVANSIVPPTSEAYKMLTTNASGNAQWVDRLAYPLDNATTYIDNGKFKLVMITKDLPTLEQLQNGTFTFWDCQELSNGTKEENSYSGVTANAIDENSVLWDFPVAAGEDSVDLGFVCLEDNFTFQGLTIPEKGVYVLYYEKPNVGGNTKQYVSGVAFSEKSTPDYTWDGVFVKNKKLETKYLPDDILQQIDKIERIEDRAIQGNFNDTMKTTLYEMPSLRTEGGTTSLKIGGIRYETSKFEITVHPISSTGDTAPDVTFYFPYNSAHKTTGDCIFKSQNSSGDHPLIKGLGGIEIHSSIPGSTKRFRITVDDTGTLSTTEITT